MPTLSERLDTDMIAIFNITYGRTDRNAADFGNADHYTVTLINYSHRVASYRNAPFATMVVPYSKGLGHHGELPTALEVMACLVMDAAGVENSHGSFEDWAGDYGYDPDSRKAERIYQDTVQQTAELRQFLGDAYDAYLWETDNDA